MENVSYIGLSQQMALKRQMDVAANNLANLDTPGFKAQSVLFLEYLNKPRGGGEFVAQVLDYASYRDLSAGALKQTYNDLDLALNGEGYFVVDTPEGPRYTRDGAFALNSQRQIVNKSGYPLLGDGGAPLEVQADASKITVVRGGVISTDKGEVGKIKVVGFENEQQMVEIGENLYDAAGLAETPVADPQVVQGALEGANVNPIVEMNRMVEILRLYQATQKMLMNDHERIRGTIQKLTRV
jgi:flagellar basal-body rod protein FlgF